MKSNYEKHVAVNTEPFMVDDVLCKHDYDDYGNHRICVSVGKNMWLEGPWTGYKRMSRLEYRNHIYVGVTDYFQGEFNASVFAVVRGVSYDPSKGV